MKQVASLGYTVIFKKAFSHPDVFTAFVKDMTGVSIEIDHVETEKRFDPPLSEVDSRFDLYSEDHKNRIIVDIQNVKFSDHYDRFLHYHCAAILEQIKSAEDYQPPRQVLTIVVLTSGDKYKTDVATIDFRTKDLRGKTLPETAHQMVYLCPPYGNAQTPEPYRQWLLAIQDSLDGQVEESHYNNDCIQKIFKTIERDLLTPQEQTQIKDEYGYAQIGRDQFEKGFEEGAERATIQLIRTMFRNGASVETLAQATNKTLTEIQAILAADQ